MYEIIAVGAIFSGFVMGGLLVVKEASTSASKIENDITSLYDQKTKLIDSEIVKTAKGIIMQPTIPTGELSSEDYSKFVSVVVTGSNLQIMKSHVSTIKDRTYRAYKAGVVCALLSLVASFLYDFGRTNSNLYSLAPVALALAGIAGFFYIVDGVFILTPIRIVEKSISRLRDMGTVEKLNEEAISCLKQLNVGHLTVQHS